MNVEVNVAKCLRELLHNWWIILISVIVMFLLSLLLTSKPKADTYTAVSTVYSVVYGSYQESVEGAAAMQTYSAIITSSKVTERASLILGDETITADMIKNLVTVRSTSSFILSIQANYSNPDDSVGIVNAVAEAFIIEVRNITGENNIQLLDKATKASVSYSGHAQQNKTRIFAVMAGFVLACAGIVIRVLFTTKIGTIKDGTLDGELEIIGVIPQNDKL